MKLPTLSFIKNPEKPQQHNFFQQIVQKKNKPTFVYIKVTAIADMADGSEGGNSKTL